MRSGSPLGRRILATTVLGSTVAFLDSSVVNVALPSIGRGLDASVAGLQWTVDGYLLSMAALILLGGALGDRFGRRRVFAIGVGWFTVASALCAAAPSAELLVLARVLQGVGVALLAPGSLAILQASFRPADRAAAIGAWSAMTSIATAGGPLAGGLLVDLVGWRLIFLINVPIGIAVVLMALRWVPESDARDARSARLDLAGTAAVVLALGGLTLALIEAADRGVGDRLVLGAAAVGMLAGAAFLRIEARSAAPMLPLGLFRLRTFSGANAVTFVVYGALGGVGLMQVLFLQTTLGWSALQAGAAGLPTSLVLFALSARAGRLATRVGARIPLTLGPVVMAGGMLWQSTLDSDSTYFADLLAPIVLFALGLVMVVAPITATALAAAGERNAGVASGVNNAVARTAQLLAVALLPSVVGLTGAEFTSGEATADAFRASMVICACAAAAGGALAWVTIDARVGRVEGSVPA